MRLDRPCHLPQSLGVSSLLAYRLTRQRLLGTRIITEQPVREVEPVFPRLSVKADYPSLDREVPPPPTPMPGDPLPVSDWLGRTVDITV